MIEAKYHNVSGGEYLGHWYGLDVYITTGTCDTLGPSIFARHGDRPEDYGSQPLTLLIDAMTDPHHRIGLLGGTSAVYADWIFSGDTFDFQKAMICGAMELLGRRGKELAYMARKANHGCGDVSCEECDR